MINLFKPHSTDPEIIRIERFVKPISIVLFIASVLAFISTFVVFNNTWTLISVPTLLFTVLLIFTFNLWLITVGKIKLSATVILVGTIFGILGLVYIDGYTYYSTPYAISILILMTMYLFPPKYIFPVTIGCIVAIFIISTIQYGAFPLRFDVTPIEILVRNCTALIVAFIGWLITGETRITKK